MLDQKTKVIDEFDMKTYQVMYNICWQKLHIELQKGLYAQYEGRVLNKRKLLLII